jgi:large subunit ribosomal protein L9
MGTMKVILKEDVHNLGEEGDVKVVKRGYARNFLLPRGLVVTYNKHNMNALEQQKQKLERKRLQKKENAEELKTKLEAVMVKIEVPAGEKGRLYGTVTNANIAEELQKLDFTIDRRDVDLKEHIKFGGTFNYRIHLYQDIYAEMQLEVIAKEEEKKTKARPARKKRYEEYSDDNQTEQEAFDASFEKSAEVETEVTTTESAETEVATETETVEETVPEPAGEEKTEIE